MEGAQHRVSGRSHFFTGLAILGLLFLGGILHSQTAFETYTRASSKVFEYQNHQHQYVFMREAIDDVLQAAEGWTAPGANPMGIEERIFNLQMAWGDLQDQPRRSQWWKGALAGDLGEVANEDTLEASIDRIALDGLRAASALRRGDDLRARHHADAVVQVGVGLSPAMDRLHDSLASAIREKEAEKQAALLSVSRGRSFAMGSFFACSILFALGIGFTTLRGLRDSIFRRSAQGLDGDLQLSAGDRKLGA